MAGVLFVVCVPTAKYEAELVKYASGKEEAAAAAADPQAATTGSKKHKFFKSSKKSDFYKSEPQLFNNQQQAAANKGQSPALSNPKLFRAVTESALDSKASQEALNIFNNAVQNNFLTPPQNQGQQINNDLAKSSNAVQANSASILNLVVPTLGGSCNPLTPTPSQPQLPHAEEDEETGLKMKPMEQILTSVLSKLKIENAVWCPGKNNNFYQVIFSTGSGEPCEECLQCLQDCGIGQKYSSVVSVIPCSLYYEGQSEESPTALDGSSGEEEFGSDEKLKETPSKVTAWSKFVASVRARLTVAQVVEQVRANAELTFDFCMLLLVAGLVAALGLVENSSVILVASMLISPLMGPILAGTFGTVIRDRQLQRVGIVHELFGLLMCLVIGFVFGLVIASIVDHWPDDPNASWPTEEMKARGLLRSLWVGVLIALPSGAGVALSVLGGNAGSLVGVAISASLLPPAVNAGLLWALAVVELTKDPNHPQAIMLQDKDNATAWAIDSATESPKIDHLYSDHKPAELAALGAISLCLTLLNILCIFIAGIIVLKIKEVAPKTSRDDLDVFWRHDIKFVRDYNRTMHGEEGKNLGKQLIEELAGMSSEKINAVVNEATRDSSFLDRIRRLSFMNGHNDMTYSGTPGRNESTWSPNSAGALEERPNIRDLEDLYATLTGQRPRSYVPLPMPTTGAAMRRRSFSAVPRRTSVTVMAPSKRRDSVSRPNSRVPNVGLATITETNSPAGTPVAKHGFRRPSSSPTQKPSKEKMRFVVTPAADDSLPNTPVQERKTSQGPILRKGDYQSPGSGNSSATQQKKFSLG
ncbi:uncharacterized protein LOC132204399 [Neocloeon triangulifer]|uniref:uncharacterized protein LOC132204399 n=1 Tax=Neocloeon triangulifer TaxID=2078957 RepID=UPI00286F86CA|nr:uncharacterized protein LOC132204399 [Neocloeon triangulifer]